MFGYGCRWIFFGKSNKWTQCDWIDGNSKYCLPHRVKSKCLPFCIHTNCVCGCECALYYFSMRAFCPLGWTWLLFNAVIDKRPFSRYESKFQVNRSRKSNYFFIKCGHHLWTCINVWHSSFQFVIFSVYKDTILKIQTRWNVYPMTLIMCLLTQIINLFINRK